MLGSAGWLPKALDRPPTTAPSNEEWLSPFEDELDVPTFIRKGQSTSDDEDDSGGGVLSSGDEWFEEQLQTQDSCFQLMLQLYLVFLYQELELMLLYHYQFEILLHQQLNYF